MAHFPDSFIDRVRERVDLIDLIGQQVKLRRSGVNWSGPCPFHQDKDPSFTVRPDKGFFKCFGCGVSGDAFTFVMKSRGLGFNEAVEELAGRVGIALPERNDGGQEEARRQEWQRQQSLLAQAEGFFRETLRGPLGARARDYLHQRGFDGPLSERFGLGFAPPGWDGLIRHMGGGEAVATSLEKVGLARKRQKGDGWYDYFRERIIFPIRDPRGRTVGFGGRMLPGGQDPKYLNSPETETFHKSSILYGLDISGEAIQREGVAVVVEGYADAVSLMAAGVEPVVATLGTALTVAHLSLLWRRTGRVLFCFDGDQAGKRAAERALAAVFSSLAPDRQVGFLFLPAGMDPDDLVRRDGAQGFRALLEKPVSLNSFLVDTLAKDLDLSSPEGKGAVIHRARPHLMSIPDGLLRELFAKDLAARVGIDAGAVLGDAPRVSLPAAAARPPRPPPLRTPVVLRENREGGASERLLLAYLLRYPRLIVDFDEPLASLRPKSAECQALFARLLELAPEGLKVVAHSVQELLASPGLGDVAREIYREVRLPDLPQEEVMATFAEQLDGWRRSGEEEAAWRKAKDLDQVSRQEAEAGLTEIWERLRALKGRPGP